ncbi:M24 family metallopeptidase [Domibacillus iocasae]|uniref:Peptidase M24 n=1 Tax=Domibacillus iocasae TaxID=1714016 RepID=A0A1E7DNA1_9BACI|nr:M24 family metallopeptidase [Domibacillus iocasae]OES44570.1 hypothetical protein BA724_09885 [Domibacillus iocasae]
MNPIEKLKKFLKENDYEGILLKSRRNFSWLTEGKHNHIVLSDSSGVADWLIFQDAHYLITTSMEEARILKEECRDLSFSFEKRSIGWMESTESIVKELTKGKRIASDTPYSDFDHVDHLLADIRSVLSLNEISRYRYLCQEAGEMVESVCHQIKPGMTEFEIASMVHVKTVERGINVQVALVATDERIYQYRHPIPTMKQLERHAMVVLCAESGGLVANVTRFVHFGEVPAVLRENIKKTAQIDVKMNAVTLPGNEAGFVIQTAMEEYHAAGFPDDWKLLHQGGLTGYQSRERLAVLNDKSIIKENQAYAWNPSLPGFKSEDTILVHKNKVEFMTHTGDWPSICVKQDEILYKRPDILVRKILTV